MPFGIWYDIVVGISRASLWAFYKTVKVNDVHNMPRDGPVLVACTHHNMIVDAAILSCYFPWSRKVHYWAKDSLFKVNGLAYTILTSGGVVPVDRKTRNNQALFKKTFEVLELGEAVGVFPEGTSHTLPKLSEFKDGTSWAALEYARSLLDSSNPDAKPAPIIPVGIVYCDKSRYRSVVIINFGHPIDIQPYVSEFLNDQKAAVKRLTNDTQEAVMKLTINAPDWDTRHVANLARYLLFQEQPNDMDDFIIVTQSLINAFVNLSDEADVQTLKADILAYKKILDGIGMKDSALANYTSKDLNMTTASLDLLVKITKTFADLPLFIPGVISHTPVYILGNIVAKQEIFEEVRAQHKIVAGILAVPVIYTIFYWIVWFTWFKSTIGYISAFITMLVFSWYHTILIDDRYQSFKELLQSFYVFDAVVLGRGMWSRAKRVDEARRLRTRCVRSLRGIVIRYRGQVADLDNVFEALRIRATMADNSRKKMKSKELAWVLNDVKKE